MPLPTIESIKNTIENKYSSNIHDQRLIGYKPIPGLLGPMFYPGGFGVVFPMEDNTKHKYAFRVWHREISGIKERTEKIAQYLSGLNLPYFVEFDFVSGGLTVEEDESSQVVDTVRMEWVDGQNLHDFITNCKEDNSVPEFKKQMRLLASNFRKMFKDLHQAGISHGDLQHGNVVILDDLSIKLVDYDSVYVPTIKGEMQITSGLTGYQHPLRKGNSYLATENDDFFSEYIIYTGLIALSINPSLWPDDDEELDNFSFLLSESDFNNLIGELNGRHINESELESLHSSEVLKKMLLLSSADSEDIKNHNELKSLLTSIVNYLTVSDLTLIKPMSGTAKSKKKAKYSQQDQNTGDYDVAELVNMLDALSSNNNGKSKKGGYSRITSVSTKIEKTDVDTRQNKYKNQ